MFSLPCFCVPRGFRGGLCLFATVLPRFLALGCPGLALFIFRHIFLLNTVINHREGSTALYLVSHLVSNLVDGSRLSRKKSTVTNATIRDPFC